ncbi:hypothetical protein Mfun01_05290 [Megamonas funiformis]|jgi:hypothetical protein|nr:hypothetical protein Mfun01_05290 [Megamonas funiformis]
MVLLLFILLRINIIIQIMFIIFIDMDYHLLYNAVVNRNNNYYQNQKTNIKRDFKIEGGIL